MTVLMERRTRWGFRFSSSNTWRWNATEPSGAVRVSSEEFNTLADCVADAITQGYVPRPGGIERREPASRKDLLGQD